MSQNSFERLEEKILREHHAPGEDFDRNLIKNISLFVQVTKITELYIPRFMGMFVNALHSDSFENTGGGHSNHHDDNSTIE